VTGLDLQPRPGAAPWPQRVAAQAALELSMTLRNGEQLLLTLVIPAGLLVALGPTEFLDLGTAPGAQARLAVLAPGVLALAVLSTAFTGLAIQTGFERRYGVLKRLGATPLGRGGLLAGKSGAVFAVEALQIVLLSTLAVGLGWRPDLNPAGLAAAAGLIVVATVALAGMGLLLAGTVRAEATLAAANLVYLVLLVGGGLIVPATDWPEALSTAQFLLPTAALADGLRAALGGRPVGAAPWLVLGVWAAAGAWAVRLFRWE
jgi:ABC-2 type transport system permease protein